MEHEHIYMLMMDALDGELAEDRRDELEVHLRACPGCIREWQAFQAIDTLFRQTPALSPAADFAERTLALLPSFRARIWTIGAIYSLLLLAGAVPILIGVWAVDQLNPIFRQPTLARSLIGSVERVLQVAGTVLGAAWNGAGEFIAQQPAVLGWLLVMVGIVALWGGVYQRALNPRMQRQIQTTM